MINKCLTQTCFISVDQRPIDVVNRVLPPSDQYSGRNGADAKSVATLAARWQLPNNNVYLLLNKTRGI